MSLENGANKSNFVQVHEIVHAKVHGRFPIELHRKQNKPVPKMKKEIRVARGYRLLPKTHKKILAIQKLLDVDSEEAIATVCKYFLKHNKNTTMNESLKNKSKSA